MMFAVCTFFLLTLTIDSILCWVQGNKLAFLYLLNFI